MHSVNFAEKTFYKYKNVKIVINSSSLNKTVTSVQNYKMKNAKEFVIIYQKLIRREETKEVDGY